MLCSKEIPFSWTLVKACPSLASWYVLSGCLFGNYLFWSSGVFSINSQNINFVFLSVKPQPFVFILPCLLLLGCFFGRSSCLRCCVNFFIIRWLLSSKERVQWALHLFPFQRTLAYVLIHQRKIDNDLLNKITKATILYPTAHFVSSRTQNSIQQENLVILALGRGKTCMMSYETNQSFCAIQISNQKSEQCSKLFRF